MFAEWLSQWPRYMSYENTNFITWWRCHMFTFYSMLHCYLIFVILYRPLHIIPKAKIVSVMRCFFALTFSIFDLLHWNLVCSYKPICLLWFQKSRENAHMGNFFFILSINDKTGSSFQISFKWWYVLISNPRKTLYAEFQVSVLFGSIYRRFHICLIFW